MTLDDKTRVFQAKWLIAFSPLFFIVGVSD